MSSSDHVNRRDFLNRSLAAAGNCGCRGRVAAAGPVAPVPPSEPKVSSFPCGTIGKAKISRMLLGGNLISGWMHSRDLAYVNSLFRAYATDRRSCRP